jgi:glycosyltransferase involved in cell wall biosynthesis
MELQNPRFMMVSAGRILMLVENAYPQDPRVRNEALLLLSAGYQVSVIGLRRPEQPSFEVIDGVRVYRVPRLELFKKTPSANAGALGRLLLKFKAFLGYVVEYFYFTAACLIVSSYLCARHGFDVLHAHNPPDTLFLVALPFKLLGKKFVFDHHDLCPELYLSRYGAASGILTRVLTFFEWCSLKLADITIATNESYRQIQIQRGGRSPESIFVVRNGPNQSRMNPAEPSPGLRNLNKNILCYIGSMNPQDGVDYLLRSLHYLLAKLKRADFHCIIMGTGDSLEDLRGLARELGLNGHVQFTGYIADQELKANLAAADICVDPDPSSPLNDVSTWIKIMEYMAFSKPIVTFDLKETRYSARDAAIYVKPNDEAQFAEAIVQLMDQPEQRKQMGEFGRRRVEKELQWSKVGENLVTAYCTLLVKS